MPTVHHSRGLRLVLVLLLISLTCVVTGQSTTTRYDHDATSHTKTASWTHSDVTYHTDITVCPTCPICAQPTTPTLRRLRYCNRFTAPLSAFATRKAGYQALLTAFLPQLDTVTTTINGEGSDAAGVTMKELPFTVDSDIRREALRNIEELLMTRVVGQPHVIPRLLAVLSRKLRYPYEPLVIHLAGDNGVGKTHTVRLISQALSLRCAGARSRYYGGATQGETLCEAGDNMLVISGTGFDGLPLPEARRRIVHQIIHHVKHYPHGIVLLDDLTAMDPALVRALAPLFGRATHFPEQFEPHLLEESDNNNNKEEEGAEGHSGEEAHDTKTSSKRQWTTTTRRVAGSLFGPESPASLAQLLVFVTTDFGRQGRTVGKSPQEIEALVRHEFRAVYGAFLPAYTRVFTYVAFSKESAEAMVRTTVATLPCVLEQHILVASTITSQATAFLVEKYRQAWEGGENGHALRRVVEDELIAQIVRYLETHGVDQRLTARFTLQESTAQVVLEMNSEHSSNPMHTIYDESNSLTDDAAIDYGHSRQHDTEDDDHDDMGMYDGEL